jgi:hypothetical protein
MIEQDPAYKALIPAAAMDHLAVAAIKAVFKERFSALEDTGLVFAGYGRNDYFPRLESYTVRALLMGKLFTKRIRALLSIKRIRPSM